jgi:ABC-type sugar transport system substrate-binding protein
MALGAVNACEELNKKVSIIGFDGIEDALIAIKNNKMIATVKQSREEIGKNIILRSVDILKGKKVPLEIYTKLELIEKKDIKK